MKLAVSGKGGVGKTTLSSSLARLWAIEGRSVIAVDADPDANLALALGADAQTAQSCTPLSDMADLIEERAGARPGVGGWFSLDPDVSDVVEMCALNLDGIRLVRMGSVESGGAGCMCSQGSFLKAFIRHVLISRNDLVILDMEAGVEHLGRGTAEAVDTFVVVVEPSGRSVQTAHAVSRLAGDLGVSDVIAVANRVHDRTDSAFVREALGHIPVIGELPYSDRVREADREARPALGADPGFDDALQHIASSLFERAKTD